jgi:hypothetical protein
MLLHYQPHVLTGWWLQLLAGWRYLTINTTFLRNGLQQWESLCLPSLHQGLMSAKTSDRPAAKLLADSQSGLPHCLKTVSRLTSLSRWSSWWAQQKTPSLAADMLECDVAVATDPQKTPFPGVSSLLCNVIAVLEMCLSCHCLATCRSFLQICHNILSQLSEFLRNCLSSL